MPKIKPAPKPVVKSTCLYLELLCRAYYDPEDADKLLEDKHTELDRPDARQLCLPVRYAWQEDPNDLHIQLDTPDGRDHLNVCPTDWDNGDYIIPFDSWLEKHLGRGFDPVVIKNHKWPTGKKHDGVLVYHFGWIPKPRWGGKIAPTAYCQLLEECWDSPNR